MKQILLFILTAVCFQISFAQTMADLEARQKEAQKALDKLTPEQKKMMEQMGVPAKVPTMSAGVSGANAQTRISGGSAFGVPAKNSLLIAAIPQITLTAAPFRVM